METDGAGCVHGKSMVANASSISRVHMDGKSHKTAVDEFAMADNNHTLNY